MIKITNIKPITDTVLELDFSDGISKKIDFKKFIKADFLSNPLSNPVFFKKVAIYQNGRGIYWPNGFDFCPDFLRYHVEAIVEQRNIPSGQS